MMKKLKPLFIENSKVPVWLSKVAPIEIYALSFGIFVWCRFLLSPTTKRHETIHFQQQLELAFVGQWILYVLFWLVGFVIYRGDGRKAYYESPFEREAYANDHDKAYLENRPRYNWVRYIIKGSQNAEEKAKTKD